MTEEDAATRSNQLLGRQDLHVHTTMSDGDLSLAEVVALADERGVVVGIADHVSSRNAAAFVSSREALDRYISTISSAPVFRSAELCWCDPFAMELAAELSQSLDYLIGSNHGFALPDGTFASPWWTQLPPPWNARPQELMEVMVHNLCDLVRTMPIAIVAHSTLLPPALLELEADVHAWWTEDREDRFVEAAREAGVAIEISNRYHLPHDRLLIKARQAGGTFSLGSDGHHHHQIARLEWAAETARRVGVTDDQLFVAAPRGALSPRTHS